MEKEEFEDIANLLQKKAATAAAATEREMPRMVTVSLATPPPPFAGGGSGGNESPSSSSGRARPKAPLVDVGCCTYAVPNTAISSAWSEMYRLFATFGTVVSFGVFLSTSYAAVKLSAFLRSNLLTSSSDYSSSSLRPVVHPPLPVAAVIAVTFGFVAGVMIFLNSIVACIASDYAYRRRNPQIIKTAVIHIVLSVVSLLFLIGATVAASIECLHNNTSNGTYPYISLLSVVSVVGIPALLLFTAIEVYKIFVRSSMARAMGLSPYAEQLF